MAAKEKESILLKEKDDKIAELKRELTIMEAEFTRELDKLSQKEGETGWPVRRSREGAARVYGTTPHEELARRPADGCC